MSATLDPARRTDRIAAARAFLAQSKLDEAELLIDEMLQSDPGHVDALALRASAFLGRGQRDRAALIFSTLATQCPDRADIVADLGVTHLSGGHPEEARLCFERAVALAPADGRHRVCLVKVLLSLRDLAAARAQMTALIDLVRREDDPDLTAEALFLAAHVALAEGNLVSCERQARQALALRPRDAAGLHMLSHVTARMNRADEALAFAEEAHVLAPTNHDVAATLARCLMEKGRFDEAERHLRRILATAPQHVDAAHLFAMHLIQKGEGAKGLAQFAGLVRCAQDNPDLVLRMATLARANGDLAKALTFVDLALKQAPHLREPAWLREEILLAMGRVDEVWPAKTQDQVPVLPPAVTVPLGLPVGEALLLARFARRLVPAGERIVCHAEPDLLPLLAGVAGLAATATPTVPGALTITSLPHVVGIGRDLATSPYLAIETARHVRWRDATAHLPRPLIGLVWDETVPGLTLDALAPAVVEALDGRGTLISLAFDARRRQLPADPDIVDAGAFFTDASELVGAIAQLDLTIGTDGLAMHVAGALGRPGLIAVPAYRPWMWAAREGQALWYPTVRVAHQTVPGRWDGVLAELKSAMRDVLTRGDEPPQVPAA